MSRWRMTFMVSFIDVYNEIVLFQILLFMQSIKTNSVYLIFGVWKEYRKYAFITPPTQLYFLFRYCYGKFRNNSILSKYGSVWRCHLKFHKRLLAWMENCSKFDFIINGKFMFKSMYNCVAIKLLCSNLENHLALITKTTAQWIVVQCIYRGDMKTKSHRTYTHSGWLCIFLQQFAPFLCFHIDLLMKMI